jgi:hypothetical protein
VNEIARPFASTIPTCLRSRMSSGFKSDSITVCGSAPVARSSSPFGPKVVLPNAWVAIAPIPAFAQGTTEPTAKNLDCTATPSSPVAGSKATIEYVAIGSADRAGDAIITASPTPSMDAKRFTNGPPSKDAAA